MLSGSNDGCLATHSIDSNVCKGGGLVDPGGGAFVGVDEGVSMLPLEGFLTGEDSLVKEMLMTLMQVVFRGGFLVDEEALESLLIL
ncbi:hypothetical protein Tco_0153604 [Tanacetum coccineum]